MAEPDNINGHYKDYKYLSDTAYVMIAVRDGGSKRLFTGLQPSPMFGSSLLLKQRSKKLTGKGNRLVAKPPIHLPCHTVHVTSSLCRQREEPPLFSVLG